MVKWNNDYNPNELANKLEEIKINNSDGTISFYAFPHTSYLAVLESMLSFDIEIPNREKTKIIRDGVKEAAQKGKITPKNILAEIDKATRHFNNLPFHNYVLVSSISILPNDGLQKRFQLSGNVITTNPHLNKKYQIGIKRIQDLAKNNTDADQPKDYLRVAVRVNGRTQLEAFDKGINSLDLLRGVWNLAQNRGTTRISYGRREPVNTIRPGLSHSLHCPDGSLATETGWYDPDFFYTRPTDISKNAAKLENFYRFVVNKLKASSYRKELEEFIILYTRALDFQDLDSAFLKLWSLLEQLTETEGSYATTIRRASFIFEEREYYQQVLKHLKDYRNKFVHEAFSSNSIETYTYQLKDCVEALLIFHIANSFGFKTVRAAADFLDLPVDKKLLEYQIKIRENAMKFLKYSS